MQNQKLDELRRQIPRVIARQMRCSLNLLTEIQTCDSLEALRKSDVYGEAIKTTAESSQWLTDCASVLTMIMEELAGAKP